MSRFVFITTILFTLGLLSNSRDDPQREVVRLKMRSDHISQ